MDPVTKECVDSYLPSSGDLNKLRIALAKYFNRVISGDPIYEADRFQNVILRPKTEELRCQNPQGQDLIRLNRWLLEDAYPKELWVGTTWQSNAELCHSCHGLQIDRYELIHQSKFATLATEISNLISLFSPSTTVKLHTIDLKDPWDFAEVYVAFESWANNYPFNEDRENYLVHISRGTFVQHICLFALVESKRIPANLVQNSPPEESTPHGRVCQVNLDLSKYDRIAARFQSRHIDATSVLKKGIQTRNVRFNKLIDEIERVAVNNTKPILLLGPTGAGKSELAERIFELRKERNIVFGEFVSLNCGTIRGEAAKLELFGHVPGSYTGAKTKRAGLVRAANRGLLFLDEIGALGMEEQTLLLRALDTKKFRPYGSDKEESSEFQLIAATNQDLEEAVQNGEFREDLLARIQLWRYELPGLKERPEDIEPNLDYELKRWTQETEKRVRMSREVRERFLRFAMSPEAKWTANFRDLIGIVERMATLAENGIITLAVLETEIDRLKQRWAHEGVVAGGSDTMLRSLLGENKFTELELFDRIHSLV